MASGRKLDVPSRKRAATGGATGLLAYLEWPIATAGRSAGEDLDAVTGRADADDQARDGHHPGRLFREVAIRRVRSPSRVADLIEQNHRPAHPGFNAEPD